MRWLVVSARLSNAITTTMTAYYVEGQVEGVNGALNYTLADGLGSVSARLSASGAVGASQVYGPYGPCGSKRRRCRRIMASPPSRPTPP